MAIWDESKAQKIKAGNPQVVLYRSNLVKAGRPKQKEFRNPIGLPEGMGGVTPPNITTARDTQILAGAPDIIIAKDMVSKDHNPGNFSTYGKLQGLKHDKIRCMLQDKRGNLWFGTAGGGICKFDGRTLTSYTEKEGLCSDMVITMEQDKDEHLWIGTQGGGVSEFDGKYFINYNKSRGLSGDIVESILQDKEGNMWFGTKGGVSKLTKQESKSTKEKAVKTFTNFTDEKLIARRIVRDIFHDSNGYHWWATDSGVIKYRGALPEPIKKGKSKQDVSHTTRERKDINQAIFSHFTTQDGLTDDNVSCIYEDIFGNLWFGTSGGISILNFLPGKQTNTFTHYTQKEGLAGNEVYCFLQDYDGNIWIGTNEGVCKFDGNRINAIESGKKVLTGSTKDLKKENGKFIKTFTNFSDKDGLPDKKIYSLLQDKCGMLWLGTSEAGLSKFYGNSFSTFSKNEGLAHNSALCILQDSDENLWFGTNGGITKFDGKTFTSYSEAEGLANNIVLGSLQDRNGNIWFGTGGGGVSRFDGKTFTNFSEKDGLIYGVVFSILEDREGNIWFGTEIGVSKFDGNRVDAINRGEKIAVQAQSDLKKVNGKFVKTFTNYSVEQGLVNGVVRNIIEDDDGRLWFCTQGGLSMMEIKKGSKKLKPSFTNYTRKEGLEDDFIVSTLKDKRGNLWFGTLSKGVIRMDGLGVEKSKDKNQLLSSDNNKIGGETYRKEKIFNTLSEKEGLAKNMVFAILQDSRDNLWFGTRFGISLLREKKLKEIYNNTINNSISEQDICFKNFTYADGFLGIGVNIGKTLLEDNNGNIWIAANDRVMLYHHTARDIQEVNGPVIEINGLSLFNEKINWSLLEGQQDSTLILGNGMKMKNYRFSTVTPWDNIPEKLSLAYDNNYISFHFTGVTLNQAQKVKYRYILEGNDNNWSALTARNEAAYGNLEPGRYRFRVKAMNSEGYWSQAASFDFEIRPPWWKTWWAYVSYVILSLLSLVLFIRRRERNLKQRQKELEIKVDEATSEIRHRKEEIEKEKHRSDELLLNILPEEVAEELKNKGEAEAKQIDEVTVLFTDFKGFTSLSEKLSPKELVHEIHECFSEFDKIMLRHGVEKIKTIGDAYMAAGGLPVPNKTHAQDVVNAALDIQAFMEMHKKERQTMGALFFEIRIGVHTGPVVAGIVGLKKFAYDIWGDTVNTASRMESSGEVGKVNISETTYVKVKDHFNCTPRGKINAKGKGEVDMYFISRR